MLTAAHVLVAPGTEPSAQVGSACEVALGTDPEAWLPAAVAWVKPEADVAVVEIASSDAGSGLAPVR